MGVLLTGWLGGETANVQMAVPSILVSKVRALRYHWWPVPLACWPPTRLGIRLAAWCCLLPATPACLSVPQTFDHGVICASEQSIVVVDEVRPRFLALAVGPGIADFALCSIGVCKLCLAASTDGSMPAAHFTSAVHACQAAAHKPATCHRSLTPQVYDAVKAELMLRGAYFLKDEEEKDRVGGHGVCGASRVLPRLVAFHCHPCVCMGPAGRVAVMTGPRPVEACGHAVPPHAPRPTATPRCAPPPPSQVRKTIIVNGRLNADIVGQSALRLADLFGIKVPEWTRVIIGEVRWLV